MIPIEPNTLYSRADLAVMLEPSGVDVDHFVCRLRPRKVFKMLWLGENILAVLHTAPALAEREAEVPLPASSSRGSRKRRGSARASSPGSSLDAYLQTLKEGRPQA